MDSRLLDMFDSVYDTKSITRGAEKLYITRQTVSSGLAALEEEIGVELFRRTRTGSVPTEAANVLRAFTAHQQELWEECLEKMRQTSAKRTFRLGASMFFMHPELFQSLLNAQIVNPGIEIGFVNDPDTSRLSSRLAQGAIDMAAVWRIPEDEHSQIVSLLASPMVVLMSEDHPLAQREAVDFDRDLSGTEVLFVSKETYDLAKQNLVLAGATGKVYEPSSTLIQTLLRSENAVFAIPRHHAGRIQAPGIVARPLQNSPICGVVSVLMSRGHSQLVDEVLGIWEKRGPLFTDVSWERRVRDDAGIPEQVWAFAAPADESAAWDLPCPWAPQNPICCAHCRQAHPKR